MCALDSANDMSYFFLIPEKTSSDQPSLWEPFQIENCSLYFIAFKLSTNQKYIHSVDVVLVVEVGLLECHPLSPC